LSLLCAVFSAAHASDSLIATPFLGGWYLPSSVLAEVLVMPTAPPPLLPQAVRRSAAGSVTKAKERIARP
jgi:hypothetical protein